MCSQELLRFVAWFCTTEQLLFVVVIMKIQTNPCSFSKVKVAFSLPEDTFEIKGWPLMYFCANITQISCSRQRRVAAAMLCATNVLPAGNCPAKSLEVGGSQGNRTLILS